MAPSLPFLYFSSSFDYDSYDSCLKDSSVFVADVGSFMAGRESILELSNLLHFSVVGDVSLSGGLTPRKADSWQLEAYRRAVCQTPQHR